MADKDKYADEIMSDDELDNVSGGAHSNEEFIGSIGEFKDLGSSMQKMIELYAARPWSKHSEND